MRVIAPRTVEDYVTECGDNVFQTWLNGLKDMRARVLVDKAVAKIRLGNLGDHKGVGEGVQEIRLDYGPGYRIYFAEYGNTLVILLCGGIKKGDIAQAKKFLKNWKERILK